MMKLAIVIGAQQILRDISKPGTADVQVKDFARLLGVDLADMEGVVEGIRLELASRERDADFVLALEGGTLTVERRVALRGVFRTQGGASAAGLALEDRKIIADQILAELPDELKRDELGKQKIVETLNLRSPDEMSAIICGAFYISREKGSVVKFWPAVMQRLKDAKDDERWCRRLEEATMKRVQAEAEIYKIPSAVIKEKIRNGEFYAKGVLPSMANRVLEQKKNSNHSN